MPDTSIKLHEEEIKKLFRNHPEKRDIWDIIWNLTKGIGTFLVLFTVFFFIVNFSAYNAQFGYFWGSVVSGEQEDTQEDLTVLETVDNKVRSGGTTRSSSVDALLKEKVGNNHLVIPKISVNAPIIWESDPFKILEDLKNGIAHYGGTALPGENGNVFLTGHSSNFWWDDGKYKQVFALLNQLEVGERVYLNYNNEPYVYQVSVKKTVNPSQIEVLNPSDSSMISLMTCTPVGTTLNRLIIQAKQIYPVKSGVGPIKPKIQTPEKLPAIR